MAIATTERVRWLQVWSLASVQGAMSLTWIAYGIYLPKFIEQVFGYPTTQAQEFAALLLLIESAIAVVVEPVFGSLSDRWQRWYSSRMPLIVAGAIAATAIFIGLPTLVIFGGTSELARLLLPMLAVLWAILMSTFRSPVICLLASFAGATQLPLAGSILTLVGGFVSSIRPLATNLIVGLGAPMTFAIASISLLTGVASLRTAMVYIPKQLNPDVEEGKSLPIAQNWANLVIVMAVGAAIGLGTKMMMGEMLPRTLKSGVMELTGLSIEVLIAIALITQALVALLTGRLCKVIDNYRLMIFSFGGTLLGLILLSLNMGAIAAILILFMIMICLSAVSNGMIAFALNMVPKSLGGLAVGIFFGGLSAAIAIFGYVVPKSALLGVNEVMLLTAIAYVVAGSGIAIGARINDPHQ